MDLSNKYESNECDAKWIHNWKSYYWVYLTRSLIGKRVAAEEVGNGIWKVIYRDVFLGYFNEKDIREKQQSTRPRTNIE